MQHWHRHAAAFLLLTGLCALCGCRNANDESRPPKSATEAGTANPVWRALNFLATQQNPDGSWGEAAANRPLLQALATLAFLSCGETPASDQYSNTMRRALDYAFVWSEQTNGVPAFQQMDADTKSATVWCLAEACGLTGHPMIGTALSRVLPNWKTGGSLPFDYPASVGIHLSKVETNSVERIRQVAMGILAQPATNQLELAMHIQAAHCIGQHNLGAALSTQLLVSCSNGWPQGEYPIIAIMAISHALYYAAPATIKAWYRMFVPKIRQCQTVCETNGWWTSQSFGITSSKELARFSPHDERIYTTALILIAHPPIRYLPSFQHIQIEEPAPYDLIDPDVRVIIR
jgi:hypothetical protein